MQQIFDEAIKPRQSELEKSLGIKKIKVKYIPSELKSNFGYKRGNIATKKVTHGLQFDPMGDL